MEILLISQKFYPENFRINDIASELVRMGHHVTAVCGIPNYPSGFYYPGYSHGQKRREVVNGVEIIRVYEHQRKNNIIDRALNYWSYQHFASLKIKNLHKNFDVVLVNELSPIMSCIPAIKYKKRTGTKLLMYEMDLWPDSLLAGGIQKKSFLYRHYLKKSSLIYASMDKILVSSKPHIDVIKKYTNDSVSISYLPQYAESIFDRQASYTESNSSSYTFLFAGNIGKAQSAITILKAAKALKSRPAVRFLFVGSGSEEERLKDYKKENGLNNVDFLGQMPIEAMPSLYSQSDALLITLKKDEYASLTLPGKTQTYMAFGKPIIASADGAVPQIVSEANCGFCGPAEDSEALTLNILKFINLDEQKKKAFSKNALNYYQNNFTKEKFLSTLQRELYSLTKKG